MSKSTVLWALLLLALYPGCVRLGPVEIALTAQTDSSRHGQALLVSEFGALGDGASDCTGAFQAAFDAAGGAGGGVVFAPTGRYWFSGTLVLPDNVTLEGVWRAPQRGEPADAGTVLYVVAGRGNAEGEPFLRMGTGAVVKGVSFYYPEQVRANPPIPYPWTIQANGASDNIAILDTTMINPYQAVDLGTYPAGRHYINNLHGYPLHLGLYINQCYDVGRIENIHFWPFWDIDPNSPLWAYTREHATAFLIGKTDGQMGHNLFSIFYRYGMRFIAGPIYNENRAVIDRQAGSGMYSNCYMDVSPCAVRVDAAMEKAGISFVNASIMSRVEVGPENRGQVKFTACGFWAEGELKEHAILEGRGAVLFSACHFNDWDRAGAGAPCIDANNRRLLVTGCEFPTDRSDNPLLVRLGPRVRGAVIASNLMPGGICIENNAPANAEVIIADNAAEPPAQFVKEWIVLGPFPNPEQPEAAEGTLVRTGFDRDYLAPLGGETAAQLTLDAKVDWTDDQGKRRIAAAAPLAAKEGPCLDMFELFSEGRQVAYAFTRIYSPREQNAYFDVGMNDGGKIFVNGRLAYERFTPHGMQCIPGADVFRARLDAGWNPVLVKLEDGGGGRWEFVFEAYGEDGMPLEASIHPPKP